MSCGPKKEEGQDKESSLTGSTIGVSLGEVEESLLLQNEAGTDEDAGGDGQTEADVKVDQFHRRRPPASQWADGSRHIDPGRKNHLGCSRHDNNQPKQSSDSAETVETDSVVASSAVDVSGPLSGAADIVL